MRAGGDCEGDEGSLGVAGVGELSGLHDVFTFHELGREDPFEVQRAELGGGCLAVGGVQVVGDGDAGDVGLRKCAEAQRLGRRIFSCPEHEHPGGVVNGQGVGCEVCFSELLRVGAIGGEEQVRGRAVLDLLRERCRGAEAGRNVGAGLVLVSDDKGGENGLEVGGGSDVQIVRGLCRGGRVKESECKERRRRVPAQGLTVP